MKKITIGTLLFVLITFIVQTLSHFVINKEHYANVPFMRPDEEVIFPLGFLTMILQGAILTYMYSFFSKDRVGLKNGLLYGFLMSLFFVSFPAFSEPAKYEVPNIPSWIAVEGIAGLIQFCLFGLLLGAVYKKLS